MPLVLFGTLNKYSRGMITMTNIGIGIWTISTCMVALPWGECSLFIFVTKRKRALSLPVLWRAPSCGTPHPWGWICGARQPLQSHQNMFSVLRTPEFLLKWLWDFFQRLMGHTFIGCPGKDSSVERRPRLVSHQTCTWASGSAHIYQGEYSAYSVESQVGESEYSKFRAYFVDVKMC